MGQPEPEAGGGRDSFSGGLVREAPAASITPRVDAWVALGGALGALSRFGVGGWATGAFPWSTFLINASGSVLLGFLHGWLPPPAKAPARRAFLTVGLCGGFTTFSAFDQELIGLIGRGEHAIATAYALSSVGVCVAGMWVGIEGGRRAVGRRPARLG